MHIQGNLHPFTTFYLLSSKLVEDDVPSAHTPYLSCGQFNMGLEKQCRSMEHFVEYIYIY